MVRSQRCSPIKFKIALLLAASSVFSSICPLDTEHLLFQFDIKVAQPYKLLNKFRGVVMRAFSYRAAVTAMAMAMVLAGCAAKYGTSPQGLEVPIEKAAVRFSADISDGGYRIVTTDELKKWLDEGKKLTLISTLTYAEERVSGIIPGALSAPLPQSEQELNPEDKEHLLNAAGSNKENLLVVYSGFVACRKSHTGAKLLVDFGYKNVYRYPAGTAGWGESGYPLKK